MIFENTTLAIISIFIIFIVLVFGYSQNKSNAIFGENNFNPNFLNSLFKYGNFSFIRFKRILIYSSFFMLAFSISGLKMGTTVKPVERKGIDIVFCVDVSRSMDA